MPSLQAWAGNIARLSGFCPTFGTKEGIIVQLLATVRTEQLRQQ
jgi:hypothetical protein